VSAAWNQASITPSVHGEFRFGSWKLDIGAQTKVDSSGKDQGVQGDISVEKDTPAGRVHVGASAGSQRVGGDPFGGVQGSLTIRLDWGAPARPSPHCTTLRVSSGFTYECMEERDVAPQTRPGVQDVVRRDERLYNLFFKYAKPTFDDARNTSTWLALGADLGSSGFQVKRIEGWASPEGPMAPDEPSFIGNDELSKRRAEAARQAILALCKSRNCMAPGAEVVGLGERLDPTGASGQPEDVSGRALEQHVGRTFPTDPGEASVQSPALTERLRRTSSLHGRAEAIYPSLRRAIVTLSKTTNRTDACSYVVEGHTQEAYLPSCPDDIRKAAFPESPSAP
jgi:hypothetical protein